jgi:hypothetical protein
MVLVAEVVTVSTRSVGFADRARRGVGTLSRFRLGRDRTLEFVTRFHAISMETYK